MPTTNPHAPRAGESALTRKVLIERLQWACEGELDGLDVNNVRAGNIVDYVLTGKGPDEDQWDAVESAVARLAAPSSPAPSAVAVAPLDAMAGRLFSLYGTQIRDRREALNHLGYTLTGLPPGPERDAALAAILARLAPQPSPATPVRGTSTYTGNQRNHGGGHGG